MILVAISSFSYDLETITKSNPLFASSMANSLPIPSEAPVIKAVGLLYISEELQYLSYSLL